MSATSPRSLDDFLAFDRYVVLGANSGGDQVDDWLRRHGKNVVAFCDLDPAKNGEWRGRPIVPLSAVAGRAGKTGAAAIGTYRQPEAASALTEAGMERAHVLPFVNDMFAAHFEPGAFVRNAPHYARIRERLADEDSRRYFDAVLRYYRDLDPAALTANPKIIDHYGYDAPGACPKPGDTIVDCGAFTGDTVPFFIESTGGKCRIIACEAYLPNIPRLHAELTRLGVTDRTEILHVALGARTEPVLIGGDPSIADGGACRGGGEGRSTMDIVLGDTLDALLLERRPARVNYLKIDIEGADLDALQGGRTMLRTHRPVVAAASYHTPDHIWQIPEYLLSVLGPCDLYAGHDPKWWHHIHFVAVPISG